MKLSINKFIDYQKYLIALSYPLYILGFRLGEYPLSVVVIVILTFDLFLLYKNKYYKTILTPFLLFIFWSVLTDFLNKEISAFLLSIAGLIVILIPIISKNNYGNFNIKTFTKCLVIGFYIATIYSIYQYLSFRTSLPILEDHLPLAKALNEQIFGGLYMFRVKSTFREPSHFVQYLIILYMIIDKYNIYFYKFNPKLLKIVIILQLIFSFSLKAIILFVVYYGFKSSEKIIIFFRNTKIRISTVYNSTKLIFISLLFFSILLSIPNIQNTIQKIPEVFVGRFNKLSKIMFTSNYGSSEGVRMNVINLIPQYIEKEGWAKSFYGEGYAIFNDWVETKAENFPQDEVNNVFVAVFLSTGFIGLLIFIIFILQIFYKYNFGLKFSVIYILIFYSSGHLIVYLTWGLIYITKLYHIHSKN